ncbi:hypothetical protein OHV08_33865 [Streptomyces canus]|uniref:hypothetical protein n=1 Tax=Streptomyces canus TaxID=58343 RepID=UPI003248D724
MTDQLTTPQLDLDEIEAVFDAAAETGAGIDLATGRLLLAEVRRLRALLPTPVAVPTKDTPLSDYDFVELVAFASKVENEGFGYAYEEYPPHFEAPELAPVADDYSLLRELYLAREEALDEFWTRSDAEAVYDAHIDEARRRRRAARPAAVAAAGGEES